MRALRFSLTPTIFFFTAVPSIVGFCLGLVSLPFYLLKRIFETGSVYWMEALFLFWSPVYTGFYSYSVPSLVMSMLFLYFLDRGMSRRTQVLLALFGAVVIVLWSWSTVSPVGTIGRFYILFGLAFFSYYLALQWFSVPIEKRTVGRIIDPDTDEDIDTL